MRQVVFGGLSATMEHIRANKLRPPLTVTTERLAPLPVVCLAFEGKTCLVRGVLSRRGS